MKRKRGTTSSPLSRRVESLLDLPEGLLGHCTRMEWVDNREVRMDGCCDILEYEEDSIAVAVAGGTVRFWGGRLCLHCLSAGSLLLTGDIQRMEFLK
ncbi:MAG: hypothetical protein E7549_01335 [Ruminococcaceae bacterium]|nr:hypothetical protein [Oscillospiraceae bacterium]